LIESHDSGDFFNFKESFNISNSEISFVVNSGGIKFSENNHTGRVSVEGCGKSGIKYVGENDVIEAFGNLFKNSEGFRISGFSKEDSEDLVIF